MSESYWQFWFEDEERLYYKHLASKWFCAKSLDGLHWAYVPEDSPEVQTSSNAVLGKFLKYETGAYSR